MKTLIIVLLCAICLAPLTVANSAEQPAQISMNEISQSKETGSYRLSKYDSISISVSGFSVSQLGVAEAVIGPDGFVNLPYAGAVKLSGLTVQEANQLLTERYSRYFKVTHLSVVIKQFGQRKVYVVGEVAKPGIQSLTADYMNIFAALSSAGGVTRRGDPNRIALVRIVDGKVNLTEINFEKYIDKRDASQYAAIQDGDMIYVPKSNSLKLILQEDVMPFILSYGTFRSITD